MIKGNDKKTMSYAGTALETMCVFKAVFAGLRNLNRIFAVKVIQC